MQTTTGSGRPGATVIIDTTDDIDTWRYTCPRGHTSWSPTNNHIFCTSCLQARNVDPDVNPEHYHVLDKRTGEEIPWDRIELRGP